MRNRQNNYRAGGSRYADKQSGAGRRRKKKNKRLLLLCLILIIVLLALCAVGALVLLERGGLGPLRLQNGSSGAFQEGVGELSQGNQAAGAQNGENGQDAAGEGQDGANAGQNSANEDQDGVNAGQNDANADLNGADGQNTGDAGQDGSQGDSGQDLVDLSILESPYAVILEADTGKVLAARRGDEKIFPASMTKILTVLTALEHLPDLDAVVEMPYDIYDALYEEDASRAGFEPGEQAVIRDLLYGALLPSGAECCLELAIQAAGSESAFVELMNQKVADLGLTQTHFTNCTGLHEEKQFSTVTEIGRILQEALRNPTFYEVFTTHHYSVAPTEVHPDGFTFWSTLFKSTVDEIVTGGEIIGGKTGYTDEAGHCLASAAELYGKIYILVTAGWPDEPEDEMYHINDAFRAYNALGAALQ